MIVIVNISDLALKQLKRTPKFISIQFEYWCELLKAGKLRQMRSIKGYHDEPLYGKRQGQRSVRLNRAYRVIYKELVGEKITYIQVLEVNKHDY